MAVQYNHASIKSVTGWRLKRHDKISRLSDNHPNRSLNCMRFVCEFLFLITKNGDVAHLTAGLSCFFSVDMNEDIVHLKYFINAIIFCIAFATIGAKQVDNSSR